jgi:hypothetical protein
MNKIEKVDEEIENLAIGEPKKVQDIIDRYLDSQKELMEMFVDIFTRLNNPLLKKLLE